MSPPDPSSGAAPLRETILREATRLFATHGYNATSIREVVEAARCTKPALYYYFANKDDLYIKVVEREIQALMDLGSDTLAASGPVRERLLQALRAFVTHAQANPFAMALLHRAEMEQEQGRPELPVGDIRKLHVQQISEFVAQGAQRGEIRNDLDPRDCAIALAGIITFQFQIWLICGEPWPEGQLERTLDILFDGIGTR